MQVAETSSRFDQIVEEHSRSRRRSDKHLGKGAIALVVALAAAPFQPIVTAALILESGRQFFKAGINFNREEDTLNELSRLFHENR